MQESYLCRFERVVGVLMLGNQGSVHTDTFQFKEVHDNPVCGLSASVGIISNIFRASNY